MIGRFLLSAALLASTMSVAQARHRIVDGGSEATILWVVDAESIQINGTIRYAWETIYKPVEGGRTYEKVRIRISHDCSRRTRVVTYAHKSDADGKNQVSTELRPEIEFIAPESLGETIFKGVCFGEWLEGIPVIDTMQKLDYVANRMFLAGKKQ